MTESIAIRADADSPRTAANTPGRSDAFEVILDSVFRSIKQKGRGTDAPFLAVLGPAGSGKSLVLDHIAHYLDSRLPSKDYCHIKIDLRQIPLASSNQMHFELARIVHDQAQCHGPVNPLQITRDNARSAFVSQIREILQAIDKYVMIYVDHSDYVPRYFARSLATQFRDILEKEDLFPELRRVGLAWSGAMSLFGLKQEVDSAFSMCKTIVTPAPDPAHRELLVRHQLEQRGIEGLPDLAIATLTSQTGGEPAFLDPIIRMLSEEKRGRQSKALLGKILKELSDPARTAVPELKEIALNVYLDRDLREIVERLLNGSVAPCREPAVDVDQYHLTGAVVLDKGTSRAGYAFRNDLVEQFLRRLFGQATPKQIRLVESGERNIQAFPGLLNEINNLHQLKEQLDQCFDLKDATALLVDAWSSATPCGRPTMAFCLHAGQPIWFGPQSGEPVDEAPFATASEAAVGAFAARRIYFATDERSVSMALPLQYARNLGAVTVTVDRSRLKVGLSEMSVHHWTLFVLGFESRLLTLCLAALGLHHVVEMEAGLSAADVRCESLGAFVQISCVALDCRGNPIADAEIAFEHVRGEVRDRLGAFRTTEHRAQRASIVLPREANENSHVEIRGSFGGQTTDPVRVDLTNSWSCEFIFHIHDGEDAWKSRKRRTGWRCRHRPTSPEARTVQGLPRLGPREQGRGP